MAEDFKNKPKPFRKFFKKIFGLPSPKDLGKSGRNALSMKCFLTEEQEKEGVYTWSDWKEEVKTKYPVRYFFNKTLIHWFAVHITLPIKHKWYWIKSHTYKKHHLLDLRQPKTDTMDDYRYGWCDQKNQVLYACFNALVSFYEEAREGEYYYSVKDHIKNNNESLQSIRKELFEFLNITEKVGLNYIKANDLLQMIDNAVCDDENLCTSEKIVNFENSIKYYDEQLHIYSEIQALYEYWTVDRKKKLKESDRLLSDWSAHKEDAEERKTGTRRMAMNRFDKEIDEEETEMLIRLIKIKNYMWN